MRRLRWLLVASVVLVGVMFVAGFPLHTYLQQRHTLATVSSQVDRLAQGNAALRQQIAKLQTSSEIEKIARQDYRMVKKGEQAYTILPSPSNSPAPPPARTGASSGTPPASGARAARRPARPTGDQGLLSKILNEFSF